MSLKHPERIRRPAIEPLEPRRVLSAVVGGAYAGDLWPTNQIPYLIDPSIKDPSGIIEAINEYNDQTTTQWVPRTNETDYVDFAYTNVPGLNESQVGDSGGEHFAYLNNSELTYIVLHEMGHVLGLWHEQTRLDSSQYIIINSQNLLPGAASMWEPGSPDQVRDVGPYDYSSIMEYNGYIGSANGLPVATELNGTPLPLNTKLSPEDISTIDMLYPVPAGQAQVARQVSTTATSANQIEIAWSDTNAGQATYAVECAVANGAFQSIATLPAGSTSYVDNQVTSGTVYEYMIVATTAANIPAVSQIVYASLPSAAPTNLTATISNGTVSLSWTDHTGGAADYVIEESVGDGAFLPVGDLAPGSTTYTVTDILAGSLSDTQYAFRVHAQIGLDTTRTPSWVSGDSNSVTVGGGGGGGSGGGGYKPISPQILGVVEVQHSKKKVSSVTIAFNEAMNAGSVSNAALYHLFGGVHKRSKIVYSKKIKVGTVSYNAAAHIVSISLAKPYKGPIRVSLDGMIEAMDGWRATAFSRRLSDERRPRRGRPHPRTGRHIRRNAADVRPDPVRRVPAAGLLTSLPSPTRFHGGGKGTERISDVRLSNSLRPLLLCPLRPLLLCRPSIVIWANAEPR